jgi:hypothetical protein
MRQSVVLVVLLLEACTAQVAPTASPPPTATTAPTATSTPQPTATPTSTPTATPTNVDLVNAAKLGQAIAIVLGELAY